MKALITGGAGFIGSHLVDRLLAEDFEAIVLDDLSTGTLDNLAGVAEHPCLRIVVDDVRDERVTSSLMEQCDLVFHLAAAVGVQLIVDEPVRTIETNIHGTEVVLAAANRFRKKVFLASSSEVYGKSEKVPFAEDDDTVLGSTQFCRWSYACSKAIDEFLALAYSQQYELPIVIGRLFNTVGPRQTGQYGMVIPRFVEQALRNQPLTIYGSGAQTRCFGFVGDVVGCVLDLMADKSAPGRVYNIGAEHEISIDELADKVIEMTGSQGGKVYIPYEEAYGRKFDDMMRRAPWLERVRDQVGFEPETRLTRILELVIEEKKSRL